MNSFEQTRPLPNSNVDDAYEGRDLNRALAEAITSGSADSRVDAEPELHKPDDDLKDSFIWRAFDRDRCGKNTSLGIDFSPGRLVILETAREGLQQVITGILVHDWGDSRPDKGIERVLRAYGAPAGVQVHVTITSPRAVVRRFSLPQIARKQIEQAAAWEARKLIPFSLSSDESLHGFQFEQDSEGQWQVTLAAVPQSDLGDLLSSMQGLGWMLESASIAGTHLLPHGLTGGTLDSTRTEATLLWSPQRATFVVFEAGKLRFHYDLGCIQEPRDLADAAHAPEILKRWLVSLEKGTVEAIGFFTSSSPQQSLERIQVLGVPQAAAPLITEWQERFGAPVVIAPALDQLAESCPEDIRLWCGQNSATLIPAFLGIAGTATIDLTPSTFRQRRQSHRLLQVARTALIASITAVVVLSGLTWTQRAIETSRLTHLSESLHQLEVSPVTTQFEAGQQQLQRLNALAAALTPATTMWMPDVRRILATLPGQARLLSLTATPDVEAPGGSSVWIRLEGLLYASDRAHSLTYADWIHELERAFGKDHVTLESTRVIDWKGQIRSGFVISVHPGTLKQESPR